MNLPASPERCLWLSVLGEQLRLAVRERDPMHLKSDCADAQRWIGSRHFHEVCHLAGLDAGWVLRRYREEMAKPLAARHMEIIKLRAVSSGLTTVRDTEALSAAA